MNQGSCGIRPGDRPFEDRRFPLVDETAGVVTAIVLFNDYLGMMLFKVHGGLIQNIEIIGGAQSRTTGW